MAPWGTAPAARRVGYGASGGAVTEADIGSGASSDGKYRREPVQPDGHQDREHHDRARQDQDEQQRASAALTPSGDRRQVGPNRIRPDAGCLRLLCTPSTG